MSTAEKLQAIKATAWREARWWCVSQIPVALVVLALAIGVLVGLRTADKPSAFKAVATPGRFAYEERRRGYERG